MPDDNAILWSVKQPKQTAPKGAETETHMAAKKKLNHVTERLGLTPMSRKPTFNEYAERRAVLVRKIESGKLKGILLQRAKEYVASLDFRVRKKRGEKAPTKAERKAEKSRAKAKAALDAGQMLLPNFVKSLDVPRIEELVAERVAQLIAAQLNAKLKKAV